MHRIPTSSTLRFLPTSKQDLKFPLPGLRVRKSPTRRVPTLSPAWFLPTSKQDLKLLLPGLRVHKSPTRRVPTLSSARFLPTSKQDLKLLLLPCLLLAQRRSHCQPTSTRKPLAASLRDCRPNRVQKSQKQKRGAESPRSLSSTPTPRVQSMSCFVIVPVSLLAHTPKRTIWVRMVAIAGT